jgi:hypothetical protein
MTEEKKNNTELLAEQAVTKQELAECKEDLAEERSALGTVAWMIGFIIVLFAITFWVAPNVFERDPESLLRYALLTIPMVLFNVCILLLAIVLLDFIVPGQILRRIGEHPIAASILSGALLLAISIAMIAGGS